MVGCFSSTPIDAKYALLSAPNALVKQSKQDRSGKNHRDGWGVACFNGATSPAIEKSVKPAYADELFGRVASRTIAPLWLAHARAASSGSVMIDNTHPFQHENWAWVHNGTIIRPLELLSETMMANIAPEFHHLRRGTTDSELCFLLFLSDLSGRAGDEINNPSAETASEAMAVVVHLLRAIAAPHRQNVPTMNFMASNGKMLLAVRWGKSLWMLQSNHAQKNIFVASEPFDDGDWKEVPERSLVIIDGAGALRISALQS